MGYRDILLYLGSGNTTATLTGNAVNFAGEQDAHLTGLYVVDPPVIPGYLEADLPDDILERYRQSYLERAQGVEIDFSGACRSRGLRWDWRCIEGETSTAVLLNGRCADLVMMAGGAQRDRSQNPGIADRVVLECGHPVLVVPAGSMPEKAGSRIVLAWNGRREAVRAVHDALPLLRAADWVKVMAVVPQSRDLAHGEVPAGDLCRHLARHGVAAEAHSISVSEHSVGETLLTWSADKEANMIVMGAYGHSRWRELLLGGVTAHVLHEAQIPVLMSH